MAYKPNSSTESVNSLSAASGHIQFDSRMAASLTETIHQEERTRNNFFSNSRVLIRPRNPISGEVLDVQIKIVVLS
jgi:hypothetical protein